MPNGLNLECNNAQQKESKKQKEDTEEVSFSWFEPRLRSIQREAIQTELTSSK